MPRVGDIRIEQPNLLLVEGRDEEEFFRRLLTSATIDGVQVVGYGGKDKLGSFLRTLTSLSKFEDVERLVVTRDADESAASAYQSMVTALENASLPLPRQDGMRPQVVTVTIPPDKDTGCLESMIWEAIVDENRSVAECIEEFVECAAIPRSGTRFEKARLYAFVASKEKPGLKIGEATDAGYWHLDHPAFLSIRELLKDLDR